MHRHNMRLALQRAVVTLWVAGMALGSGSVLPWYHQEQPVLKISGNNYDKAVIYHQLQTAYENKYTLAPDNHAHLYLGNLETERQCIEHTVIKYYIKTLEFTNKEYEASECRINMNPQYQVVITPTIDLEFLHNEPDPVIPHLQSKIIEKVSTLNIPRLSNIQFYDFGYLNYDLQCNIDYQDISQIKFDELNLKVTLQQIMTIPEQCGFDRIDKDFDGEFMQMVDLEVPINGTFYCKNGRSSTCKKAFAERSNPKYKLFAES